MDAVADLPSLRKEWSRAWTDAIHSCQCTRAVRTPRRDASSWRLSKSMVLPLPTEPER